MNNNTDITLHGNLVKLTFGMIANEEFMRLQLQDIANGASGLDGYGARVSSTLNTANIIYAGAYNWACVNRVKVPEYAEIVDGVEGLFFEQSEQSLSAITNVMEVWKESRFGKNFTAIAEASKKKLEENQNHPIGIRSEGLPMED
jgi:hypothetical protein